MISATVRDLAIIIVAMQTFVLDVFLIVLIWQIWRLAKMLQTGVRPILDDAQETSSTIRGTTTFVSDNVLDPVIRTSRTVTRVRTTLSSLARELRNDRPGGVPTAAPPSDLSSREG